MNFGEILRRTLRMAGDTSGALFIAEDVMSWANEGQIDIVRRTECLTDTYSADVSDQTDTYELPNDFLDFIRVTLDGYKLTKTTVHQVDGLSPDRDVDQSGGSTPHSFYQLGDKVVLFPRPVSDQTLRIQYVRRPIVIAQNTDTPEIPLHMHGDLLQYCIAKAKEMDEDTEGASVAMADYERRMTQAVDDTTDNSQDSYPSIRACPGDDW